MKSFAKRSNRPDKRTPSKRDKWDKPDKWDTGQPLRECVPFVRTTGQDTDCPADPGSGQDNPAPPRGARHPVPLHHRGEPTEYKDKLAADPRFALWLTIKK
jgi:hypothetical protein